VLSKYYLKNRLKYNTFIVLDAVFLQDKGRKIMRKDSTLEDKIASRIARKKCSVLLRDDFRDLGDYDQVGRALRKLAAKSIVMKIGYGLYAKASPSFLTGELVPEKPLPSLAKEALARLGVKTVPSTLEREYNAGRSTQVPTGRMIAVKGRVSRKIGYDETYISYERAS
jgi:hypothetical protein